MSIPENKVKAGFIRTIKKFFISSNGISQSFLQSVQMRLNVDGEILLFVYFCNSVNQNILNGIGGLCST